MAETENVDFQWSLLYKIAGSAALLTVLMIPVQLGVFVASPPPGFDPSPHVVEGYFALFQKSKLIALLDLDLLLVVDQLLGVPIALALYVALRKTNQSAMLIATVLGLVCSAAYCAFNGSFAMLALSNQYTLAATDAEKSALVTAGTAVLANHLGTGFHFNYIVGSLTIIIVGAVMLRSPVFSKLTAYAGIGAGVVGLGLYVPRIGILLSILSVPLYALWNTLISRRFFRLAQPTSAPTTEGIGNRDDRRF